MARVEVTPSLEKQINKEFKKEAITIFKQFLNLQENPKKGKALGTVSGIAIKELKYKSFRFYFITDAHKVRFYQKEELEELLIRFVRISHKKHQQETIDEIRTILLQLGPEGL